MRELLHFVDNTIPGQCGAELIRFVSETRRLARKIRLDGRALRDIGLDRRSS